MDPDNVSITSFLPEAESTRMQLDGFADDSSNPDVRLRSTARAYKYPYLRRQMQRTSPSTSVVKQHFRDWDYNSDESFLQEKARGAVSPVRSSPGPVTVDMGTPGHDSLYEITRSPTASFLRAARERVAREEQQRDVDAVASRLTRVSPAKSNTSEARRTRFGTASIKKPAVEEEGIAAAKMFDLTSKTSTKKSRFGSTRTATSAVSASATFSKPSASPARNVTSTAAQPARPTTPRSTTNTVGITQQSFGLPDLPNLTELMSGMYKDGTPIFSRSAKGRSRFRQDTNSLDRQPHLMPVENVPVPEDEKVIYASLQLLKDKIAQLEQEKAEADKRLEEQESELIELRVQLDTQSRLRRSDSGFGSDDEGKAAGEVTKLTASLEATQKKLASAQRKLEVGDIALKRVTKERDTAVTQLGSAFYNSEELKSEQTALQKENDHLREEVDQLRIENEQLRQSGGDGQKSKAARNAENTKLKQQLLNAKAQHEEDTQRIRMEEADARQRAEQRAQREQEKLRQEKIDIGSRLKRAIEKHQEEARQWELRHAELQQLIDDNMETTQQMQTATLAQAAEDLRVENEKLKGKLARQQQQAKPAPSKQPPSDAETLNRELEDVVARHEEESLVWTQRETELKEKIARLKTRKSILKNTSANTASQRFEESGPTSKLQSLKPIEAMARAVSAGVLRTLQQRREDDAYTSGGFSRSSAKHNRRVSAPVSSGRTLNEQDSDVTDAESTTDLDLSQLQRGSQSGATRNSVAASTSRHTSRHDVDADTTTLSFMAPIDIAKIRQQVEEEYRQTKRKEKTTTKTDGMTRDTSASAAFGLERSTRSPSATRHREKQTSSKAASGLDFSPSAASDAGASHDDTARSNASTTGLRRTSSKHSVNRDVKDDHTSTSVGSQASRLSRKSAGVDYGRYLEAEYGPGRRRRSAPEMTSAFILPDITMRAPSASFCDRATLGPEARKLMDEMSPHDIAACTVCYRLAVEEGHQNLPKLAIPQPTPVTDEPREDPDATMRPAMSPQEALATTIKQLEDELKHKKSEMLDSMKMLEGHDPRKGSRMRRGIQKRIDTLNAEIRTLSQNVYNLMDVLEGQKAAGQLRESRTERQYDEETTFSGLSDH